MIIYDLKGELAAFTTKSQIGREVLFIDPFFVEGKPLPGSPKSCGVDQFFKHSARTRGTMEILGLLAAGEPVTLTSLLEKTQLSGDELIKHLTTLRQSDAFEGELASMANKVWNFFIGSLEQHQAATSVLEMELTTNNQNIPKWSD